MGQMEILRAQSLLLRNALPGGAPLQIVDWTRLPRQICLWPEPHEF
jgi:hypothetical protein